MTQKEAEFMAKLLATFKVESDEHLKVISDGLLSLEGKGEKKEKKDVLESIYREAHSLKGAARAVNLEFIQDICQSLENVLSAWKENKIQPSPKLYNTLYAAIDMIGNYLSLTGAQGHTLDTNSISDLVKELESLKTYAAQFGQEPESIEAKPYKSEKKKRTKAKKVEKKEEIKHEDSLAKSNTQPEAAQEKLIKNSVDKTIRVSSQKLDKLMQEVEEMLMVKITSRRQMLELKSFNDDIKHWEKMWNHIQTDAKLLAQGTKSMMLENVEIKHAKKWLQLFDFLEWQQEYITNLSGKASKLTIASSQDCRVLGGMVDTLLEDTKKVLMQPLGTLLDTFPRMVRDMSQALGKEVLLEIQGSDIEVDRRILEEMKDPMIHLLRNSIDHGIEPPEIRKKKNKSSEGTITISGTQVSGNSIEIVISDNGAGINLEKVKECAVKQGILSQKDIEGLNPQEAAQLIFHSGVSTSPIITDISGRGLGMGIVSEKVEKLGGQYYLETKPDEGTTIKVLLPLSLATFRGIHVRASGHDFIIPTHNVKRVLRIDRSGIKTVEGKETVCIDKKAFSYEHLSNLLMLERNPVEDPSKLFIIILKTAETAVALGVDQILNEQEVFIKGLGKMLKRVKNIGAATVMEWGKVIPILESLDLIKSIAKKPSAKTSVIINQEKMPVKKKRILVVEDSMTARMLLKNILETAGYSVKTAVDGAEGFSMLKQEKPDLLLSDIEMPRMDGLELTKKVRSDEKLKELPVVLCTARGSKEDREKGIELGANAYITKSDFVQSNLLDIIQKLL